MREHAEEIKCSLEPAIVAKKDPGAVRTLSGFVKDIYLPFVEKEHRNSTYDGYRDMWEDHVRRVAGDTLLRTVRTFDVEKWLDQITSSDKLKDGRDLSREPEAHQEADFWHHIFAHAKRMGFYDGVNPVADTTVKSCDGEDTTHIPWTK